MERTSYLALLRWWTGLCGGKILPTYYSQKIHNIARVNKTLSFILLNATSGEKSTCTSRPTELKLTEESRQASHQNDPNQLLYVSPDSLPFIKMVAGNASNSKSNNFGRNLSILASWKSKYTRVLSVPAANQGSRSSAHAQYENELHDGLWRRKITRRPD